MTNIVLKENVGVALDAEQQAALSALVDFTSAREKNDVFILSGSAGTGKTALLRSYVRHLRQVNSSYRLLAPTGQAAKVIFTHTGFDAQTVHSFLYDVEEIFEMDMVKLKFLRKVHFFLQPIVIIVDEASMISSKRINNEDFTSETAVMDDLVAVLKSAPLGSKLVFIGDSFQLPPIGEHGSVALDKDEVIRRYGLDCSAFALMVVKRFEAGSKVAENALFLRECIERQEWGVPNLRYEDLFNTELAVAHYCSLDPLGENEELIFLGWKNVRILELNRQIRRNLHGERCEFLVNGDRIIMGQTVYHPMYLSSGQTGFIESVDMASLEVVAGNRFIDVVIVFKKNAAESIRVSGKLDVDYLTLSKVPDAIKRRKALWADRKKHNPVFRESERIADDAYLSAFKVKYGHAITVHKAQGGEWEHVFLYPEYPLNAQVLRWLYTAVTRASKTLYSFKDL
jgi:exodeoxyribonuclease V